MSLSSEPVFRQRATAKFQVLGPGLIERHRHRVAYAAIVLDGSYVESGDQGRMQLGPADFAVHGIWDAHRDRVDRQGSRVLNLETPALLPAGFYRSSNLDEIVRLAGRGEAAEAAALLCHQALMLPRGDPDWPELLVEAINTQPELHLAEWAARHRLRPADVSSAFKRRYGVSPKRFRAEVKARKAWRLITSTPTALAEVAAEAGFVDQAHMTRALMEMTSFTPARARRAASAI